MRPRSGIIYPLLPLAQHPDTHVAIDAALPEAAALGRQNLPPTVLEIGSTSQPETKPTTRRRASRKPSRKRRRNHSAGVFRSPKRSTALWTSVRVVSPVINKAKSNDNYKQNRKSGQL